MAYEYKYLSPAEGSAASTPMLERMDEKLATLLERKGRFYTSLVEFLTEVRMFNAIGIPNEKLIHANSRFVGRFVMVTLDEIYGEGKAKDRLAEAMKDCEELSDYVLYGVKQ